MAFGSRENSASVEFQGQEVLSLRDTLRCSTCERIRWSHRENSALCKTSYGHTYENQIFILVHKWPVSEETRLVTIRHLCTPSTRKSTHKSGTRMDYFTRLRSPAKRMFKCLIQVLRSDVASETQTSRTLCITPAALLGRLGLTAVQRYDAPRDWIWEAWVRWAWLGIPIFGSDFWDPHRKWNSDSVFDSEDSSRKIFLEFCCWKIEKSKFQFQNSEFREKKTHKNSIHLISCMMSILIGQPVGLMMFILWT